jgi:hypothetical protein
MNRPRLLLHLEGAAAAVVALAAYFDGGHPWWLLVALVLVPDVSFAGYLGGPRLGAAVYNVAHTYIGPLVLLGYGILGDNGTVIAVALIWVTHIGVDRALGYGLKYPTAFKDTHLQRV